MSIIPTASSVISSLTRPKAVETNGPVEETNVSRDETANKENENGLNSKEQDGKVDDKSEDEENSLAQACLSESCSNKADTLQCPTCQKAGKNSFFCSQECFKTSWPTHKLIHKAPPFSWINKGFEFTGPLRPVYPLSDRRMVPSTIPHPDYAEDPKGFPKSEARWPRSKIAILNKEEQEAMRVVCRLSREVLDEAAAAVRPGVTTDEIDEIVHMACIKRNAYPSPLNYWCFPKSVCTSVNEVICHGIPDQRVLQEGDIINIDVSLYHNGFHGDINETYYVGDKAKANPTAVRVVETARECLNKAIELVKPGTPFRAYGDVISKHAKENNCSVVKTYCGHGVNQLFHGPPNVPHYAGNKAAGIAKPGMCFTIEPMINIGKPGDKTWPDDWTSVTVDGCLSAQFEHTLLVTEDGVEVLTARLPNSPGGPVPRPTATK